MLLWLCDWFKNSLHWKIPAAFTYFSTRMILAALTSLLFTIFLGPRFIKKLYEMKIGQSIRGLEECPLLAELHGEKKDTPTMGGILILSAMIFSLLLWMDWQSAFTILLLLTTGVLGTLGARDDFLKLRYKNSKGLSSRKKLLCQVLFSSGLALYLLCPSLTQSLSGSHFFRSPSAKEVITVQTEKGKIAVSQSLTTEELIERVYCPFFKNPIFLLDGWLRIFSFLLIIFVITGASNAVNLTDGLDGLAAGCLILSAFVLSIFAFFSNHLEMAHYLNILYIEGSGEIAVYLFALAGASLGFLWYNGYPAQVFMGDTGSLALGGVLGVSAIVLRRELILALAGIVFVAEALSVILQVLSYRYRNKKRIFLIAPLHHHFEYKGWPETKVVIRFWIVGLLFAIIAIASLKFQ